MAFAFDPKCANLAAVRAVALLAPFVDERYVRRFHVAGVSIFAGNDLDPTDEPAAALIFGGDGTLHRHLAGLSQKHVPTLIVPVGSANDFAQSVGIRTVEQSLAAWRRFCFAGDNVRSIDLGTIQPIDPTLAANRETTEGWSGESLERLHFVPDGPRDDLPRMGPRIMQSQLRRAAEAQRNIRAEILFAGIAGTGLDAAVNRQVLQQSRRLRAHGGYVLALLQVLGRFQPPRMTISAEIDGEWRAIAEERGVLVAVGNGPQYGNSMRLTHGADMHDGKVDLCFVRNISKFRLLRFFPVVFSGGHIGMKEVEYVQATRVRIATDPVSEIFADGEPVCSTPVEIGVRRNALRVIG